MKRLAGIILALLAGFNLSAQNQKSEPADSLVRLMSAQSAQMIQNDSGSDLRKVIGPARFLHNGTYLICDTALWYVDTRIINAFGHVKILQDETVLTSDKLDYYIDDNLAQFRGSVVQLQDKEKNTLRTRNLDYNTKDSVAFFRHGGAMRDKDGQIIESENGSYDSKTKIFTFERDVNMFTDSVFVLTSNLIYHGDTQEAEFDEGVDAWKEENMLSADRGYYDRANEVFHFYDNVHGMSDVQEGWSDTLHFYRLTKNIELQGQVQLRDTSRRVAGMAEYVTYEDSTAILTMSVNATMVAEVEDTTNKVAPIDTVYMGADRIVYRTFKMCDVDAGEKSASQKRVSDIAVDPVTEYRKKSAEEAAAAAEEAKRKREEEMGGNRHKRSAQEKTGGEVTEESEQEAEPPAPPENEEPSVPEETLSVEETAPATEEEVSQAPADTAQSDTTKVAFIYATGNVRVYKSDMQARCDSLAYNELDSLVRMYLDPIVWNEGNRQYTSDSLTVVSENGHMRKACLMSNAFITIQEDSLCFDQIRGAEMTAFFDSTTVLERFDALGGASAVFFLEENDALATVNKVESKMLTANFNNGEIEKIYYYDAPKNNAYPVVQLAPDERCLKGFKWNPEKRPACREDVTPYELRDVERDEYSKRLKPEFNETDLYFPGYMDQVYNTLAERDSLRKANKLRRNQEVEEPDEVVPTPEELAELEKASAGLEPAEGESASEEEPSANEGEISGNEAESGESAEAEKPESEVSQEPALGENEIEVGLNEVPDLIKAKKEAERKAREEAAEARKSAREAKWAQKDAKDQAKAAKKAEKQNRRLRRRAAKIAAAEAKEAAKEQKLFERYKRRYEIKKSVQDAKKSARDARKAEERLKQFAADSAKKTAAKSGKLQSADVQADNVKDSL